MIPQISARSLVLKSSGFTHVGQVLAIPLHVFLHLGFQGLHVEEAQTHVLIFTSESLGFLPCKALSLHVVFCHLIHPWGREQDQLLDRLLELPCSSTTLSLSNLAPLVVRQFFPPLFLPTSVFLFLVFFDLQKLAASFSILHLQDSE